MSEQLSLFPITTALMPRSWVYVMSRRSSHGARLYKIGWSCQPATRARKLDATLIGMMPGGRSLERQLHRRFARYRLPGTEWFLPARPLVEWIDQCAAAGWN